MIKYVMTVDKTGDFVEVEIIITALLECHCAMTVKLASISRLTAETGESYISDT